MIKPMSGTRHTKRRVKRRILRFRKNDPEHNLLAAAQQYIHSKGGSLIVIGGIEIQDWAEGAGKFKIAVRCLGRKPEVPQ